LPQGADLGPQVEVGGPVLGKGQVPTGDDEGLRLDRERVGAVGVSFGRHRRDGPDRAAARLAVPVNAPGFGTVSAAGV